MTSAFSRDLRWFVGTVGGPCWKTSCCSDGRVGEGSTEGRGDSCVALDVRSALVCIGVETSKDDRSEEED